MNMPVSIQFTDGSATPSLYYLRTFHAVATERSFTLAGRKLDLSQPAVSAQIRALERQFGGRLFEVRKRRVYLTAEGEALLPYVERVLALLREAEDAVAATQGLERGYLAFGASTTIGNYLLPPVLARFTEAHPGLRVDVAVDTSAGVAERVLADELPFGLVEAPATDPGLEVRAIGTDEMILIAPPNHPWVRGGPIAVEELRHARLVRREAGSGTHALVEQALGREGVAMPVAAVLGSTEALKEAVLAGLGVAWVPRLAVARELRARDLAAVAVRDFTIPRTLSLVIARGRSLSPAGHAFVTLIERMDPPA